MKNGLSKRRAETALHVSLDKIGDIHGHLVDLGVVELLNVFQTSPIVLRDEVDGDAFTTKSTATADSERGARRRRRRRKKGKEGKEDEGKEGKDGEEGTKDG